MALSSSGKDINVTPLIDVLLVLLVIFLVVMPAMMKMETIDVPPHNEDAEPAFAPAIVKVHADFTISIDDGPSLAAADLPAKLRAIHPKVVFVTFEDGVPWNDVIATVDTVRGATDGATVALKTD